MKTQGTDTLFTAIAGGLVSTIAYLIGGIDNLVNALVIFMVIDILTGLLSAKMHDSVDSMMMYRGLAKKSGMFSFVILANQLDIISTGDGSFARNAMIMFVIGMEGISIKENAERMGFTAPSFITDIFDKFTAKKEQ